MNLELAEQLAVQEMAKWQAKMGPGWKFVWSRAKRLFGYCSYRNRVIKLSAPLTLLNPESRVLNTIRHEIAHAIAGHGAGHGHDWKRQAVIVGCEPVRCYGADVARPSAKYVSHCPACGRTGKAHRRRNVACRLCCDTHNGGLYNIKFKLTYTRVSKEVAAC